MGYMGDRAYPSPLLLVQEILSTALDNSWIRDEIYCQIIKQVSSNPSSESTSKGWQIMALSLETFPPNSEFENFLEMYLRSSPNSERYIRILHATVYGGARRSPPTEQEIHKIIAGGTLQTISYEEKKEYQVPRAQLRPKKVPESDGDNGQVITGHAPHSPKMTPQPAPTRPEHKSLHNRTSSNAAPPAIKAPSRTPKGVKKPVTAWAVAVHPDTGQEYFYNTETNEVTWDRPADMD